MHGNGHQQTTEKEMIHRWTSTRSVELAQKDFVHIDAASTRSVNLTTT